MQQTTIVHGSIAAPLPAPIKTKYANKEFTNMKLKLFKNNRQSNALDDSVLSLMDDEPSEIDNQAVLDYIVDLTDEDYDKLIKVAKVYRDAQKRANDIMGVKAADGDIIPVRVETNDTAFIEDKKQ
jgi:hypothetical protein